MSPRLLLLASGQAGAGRTTLAANLAGLLGQDGPCWLLESLPAAQSELALQLGTAPQRLETALGGRGAGIRHVCLPDEGGLDKAWPALSSTDGWAILDGATLAAGDLGPALQLGCA
ncbi:MAG TPA: hypothetical protein VNZ67_10850, partial [bacterium]|nr:hypothetical protein [bacterium]